MKKRSILKITASFTIVMAMLLSSCATTPKESKAEILEPVNIQGCVYESGNLVITNLPHFELMCLLCRIAEVPMFDGYYNDSNSYLEQMNTLLGRYKDHKIITTIKSFVSRGVTGDGFISLVYHLQPDFTGTVVPLSPKPETLHYSWEKIPATEINSFVKMFHDFAIESNFERIYGLNNSMFIGDALYVQKDLEKYKMDTWMQKFFTIEEIPQTVNINVSRSNVGFGCYDFALDENGNRNFYLSAYPGQYLSSISQLYCLFYTQLFASENWDEVKDTFIPFIKSVVKKTIGDNKDALKELEKVEITDWHLSSYLSEFINAFYISEISLEVDETSGILDEYYNTSKKVYGEKVTEKTFELIYEYRDNREKYPDFKSYYPNIKNYILNLKEVE